MVKVAKITDSNSCLSKLEDYVQLHEEVTVWYVVDGWQAFYTVQDGEVKVAEAHGPTISLALAALCQILDKKTLAEWRKSPAI